MSGKWETSGLQNIQKNVMAIRLAASESSTHFTIHVQKENLRSALNKQAKNNVKDKIITVLNRYNGDYVPTNSWKPLFMKMGSH